MRKLTKLLPLLLLIFLLGCPKGGDPSPGPPVPPVPVPAPGNVPSAEMQQIVSQMVPISEPGLAEYCGDFADVLERDTEVVKTVQQVSLANAKAGQLVFQKTGRQSNPVLASQMEAAVVAAVGKQNVGVDTEHQPGVTKRKRLVEVFRAMEWALK